jgi:hypothetical protein
LLALPRLGHRRWDRGVVVVAVAAAAAGVVTAVAAAVVGVGVGGALRTPRQRWR